MRRSRTLSNSTLLVVTAVAIVGLPMWISNTGCSESPHSQPQTMTIDEAETMTREAVTPLVQEIKMLNDALDEANETILSLERRLAYANRECEQLAIQRDQLQQRVDSLGQQFNDLSQAVNSMNRSLRAIQDLLPETESPLNQPSRRQAMRDSDDD